MDITLDEIELPSPETFYREYMCRLKPVIIKDLFKGDPIRDIVSFAKAVEVWGEVAIAVQDEYGKAYQDAARGNASLSLEPEPQMMPLAEYYALVEADPDTEKMCIEFRAPPAIAATYRIPEVCRPLPGESPTLVNQCFIGNAGNHAQIHFDKAGMHGFLYQVFGKKRFIFFPHEASHKLGPFTQLGTWHLENFSREDREAFLAFTGGVEFMLEAGDCVFLPSLWWHAVQYVEHGMSISLRFRRPDHITMLVNNLFPDMYLQGIAHKMPDPARVGTDYAPILAEIETAARARNCDGVAHVRRMRRLARDIHKRLYPDMPESPYMLDLEEHFPNPIPHFLDADNPARPTYR